MSEESPSISSGDFVAAKAIFDPSGDQSKPPTVKSPFVRRFVFFDSTSITQRCVSR